MCMHIRRNACAWFAACGAAPHTIPRIYSAEAEMNFHFDNEPSERTKQLQREKQLDKFFLKQNGSFRRKPTE